MKNARENIVETIPAELISGSRPPSKDWLLCSLISTVNSQPSLEISITVNVSGAIVTGYLISGATYFREFADAFSSAFPGDDASKSAIRDAFIQPAALYESAPNGEKTAGQAGEISYLHLRKAQFFSPMGKATPQPPGMLWRGRISEVSGFSLGQLIST